jgi:hypothetical protein
MRPKKAILLVLVCKLVHVQAICAVDECRCATLTHQCGHNHAYQRCVHANGDRSTLCMHHNLLRSVGFFFRFQFQEKKRKILICNIKPCLLFDVVVFLSSFLIDLAKAKLMLKCLCGTHIHTHTHLF